MNAKQAIPLATALAPVIAAAPPLLIGGAIGLGIVLVLKKFMDSKADKQPDAMPTKPDAEASRKPAETGVFQQVPAVSPAKTAVPVSAVPSAQPAKVLSHATVQPAAVRPVPAVPATVHAVVPVVRATPPAIAKPIGKKIITRADVAMIFDNGKRALSRTAAVTALRRLGFSKSAAYSALSPDGRFSGWLDCAPDGIISWTDGQKI